MSDKLLTLRAEDFRIEPQEVRVGPYSYMKGHPPFLTTLHKRVGIDLVVSAARGERLRTFDAPTRPHIFTVDAIADLTPDGLLETTPTPGLRVMGGHARMYANGLWLFADGIPVVEGVRAWNQANPQERVSLVAACQDARVAPDSIDISPFRPDESIMAVYAGRADVAFGLTDSGKVLGIIKVAQFPDMRRYLASLPTFKV